jgi:ferredoxin--NADP+ reductase
MGNVMADIARWLLRDDPASKVEEVVVVARRGPLEAKFDEKEFANIHMYLDRADFAEELQRVKPQMEAAGQDVAKVPEETFPCLTKFPAQQITSPRLKFRFLSSPFGIFPDRTGRIARLLLAENELVNRNGSIVAESTLKTADLDVDTMIFAIGDMHDCSLGLPFAGGAYATNPDTANPNAKYEVFDPRTGSVVEGMFVVGWARKPSEGLVGIARHDGETGAAHVIRYLETTTERRTASIEHVVEFLERRGIDAVTKEDLACLLAAEQLEAGLRKTAAYKFSDDAAMLEAIAKNKFVPAVPSPLERTVAAQGALVGTD